MGTCVVAVLGVDLLKWLHDQCLNFEGPWCLLCNHHCNMHWKMNCTRKKMIHSMTPFCFAIYHQMSLNTKNLNYDINFEHYTHTADFYLIYLSALSIEEGINTGHFHIFVCMYVEEFIKYYSRFKTFPPLFINLFLFLWLYVISSHSK